MGQAREVSNLVAWPNPVANSTKLALVRIVDVSPLGDLSNLWDLLDMPKRAQAHVLHAEVFGPGFLRPVGSQVCVLRHTIYPIGRIYTAPKSEPTTHS